MICRAIECIFLAAAVFRLHGCHFQQCANHLFTCSSFFFLPSMLRWRTPANLAAIMACTMLGLATHAQRSALILCPILIADMIRRQTNTALVFQVASLLQSFAKIARQQAAINAWPKQHMCLIAAHDIHRHMRTIPCGCRHGTATTQRYRRRLKTNANTEKTNWIGWDVNANLDA